jgi:hypothetical protein
MKTVRFDEAIERVLAVLRAQPESWGDEILLVRDLTGRIRVALRNPPPGLDETRAALEATLREAAGAFCADEPILLESEMFAPASFFDNPEARALHGQIRFLERQFTGSDWTRPLLENAGRRPVDGAGLLRPPSRGIRQAGPDRRPGPRIPGGLFVIVAA